MNLFEQKLPLTGAQNLHSRKDFEKNTCTLPGESTQASSLIFLRAQLAFERVAQAKRSW